MNQSNIDYLYQVFAPLPDRTTSGGRNDGGAAAFNSHFSQATTSVLDIVHASPREVARTNDISSTSSTSDDTSQRFEEEREAAGDSSHSKPADGSNNGATSALSDSTCGPCQAAESASKPESSEDDERDTNEPQDNEVAAEAAAAQDNSKRDTKAEASKEHVKNEERQRDKVESLEAAAAKKQTAAKVAKPAAAASVEASATLPQDSKAEQGTVAGRDHLAESQDEVVDKESAEASSSANQSATSKPQKATKQPAASPGTQSAEQSAEQIPAAAVLSESGQATGSVVGKTANIKTKDGVRKSTATDNDSDDSGAVSDGKNGDDAAHVRDGSVASNSPAAAATVNGIASSNGDAVGNVKPDADKDSAIKPVGSKSETAVGPLGRALRSAVDLTRGVKSSDASENIQIDPARFINRVSRAIQTAHERGGSLQLRLAPPELGALKIQLDVKDGVMSASLEADNANARKLLLDHLPALRDRLAEQNIRVERFDVDVRQENNSGQANSRGSNQNPYQQQAEQPPQRRNTNAVLAASESLLPALAEVAPSISSTGINLVI